MTNLAAVVLSIADTRLKHFSGTRHSTTMLTSTSASEFAIRLPAPTPVPSVPVHAPPYDFEFLFFIFLPYHSTSSPLLLPPF